MIFPPRYRRELPEKTTKAIVGNRPIAERLGKMPMMPRVTKTPFAQTRQTLPVLLDRCVRLDDSQVGITDGADS